MRKVRPGLGTNMPAINIQLVVNLKSETKVYWPHILKRIHLMRERRIIIHMGIIDNTAQRNRVRIRRPSTVHSLSRLCLAHSNQIQVVAAARAWVAIRLESTHRCPSSIRTLWNTLKAKTNWRLLIKLWKFKVLMKVFPMIDLIAWRKSYILNLKVILPSFHQTTSMMSISKLIQMSTLQPLDNSRILEARTLSASKQTKVNSKVPDKVMLDHLSTKSTTPRFRYTSDKMQLITNTQWAPSSANKKGSRA